MANEHISFSLELCKSSTSKTHTRDIMKNTMEYYKNAVSYICNIVYEKWNLISLIQDSNKQFNYVEHLIHNTNDNVAICDFDKCFYKMPSYIRRAATRDAIGHIPSYQSNCANYEQER